MSLLNASDYPAVRAALDVTLDAATLPDAVIALDIHSGAAEREVKARIPNAEAKTGDDLARVRAAAIWLTAANLAPSLPQVVGETQDGYAYTRQAIDAAKLAATLRERALDALRIVAASSRPTQFTVGRGQRGR